MGRNKNWSRSSIVRLRSTRLCNLSNGIPEDWMEPLSSSPISCKPSSQSISIDDRAIFTCEMENLWLLFVWFRVGWQTSLITICIVAIFMSFQRLLTGSFDFLFVTDDQSVLSRKTMDWDIPTPLMTCDDEPYCKCELGHLVEIVIAAAVPAAAPSSPSAKNIRS